MRFFHLVALNRPSKCSCCLISKESSHFLSASLFFSPLQHAAPLPPPVCPTRTRAVSAHADLRDDPETETSVQARRVPLPLGSSPELEHLLCWGGGGTAALVTVITVGLLAAAPSPADQGHVVLGSSRVSPGRLHGAKWGRTRGTERGSDGGRFQLPSHCSSAAALGLLPPVQAAAEGPFVVGRVCGSATESWLLAPVWKTLLRVRMAGRGGNPGPGIAGSLSGRSGRSEQPYR